MRILVAPQEFKGSLTAVEAASAIAAGLLRALPDLEVDRAPMSDGGPGLVDVLLAAAGGGRREAGCHDPLMRSIRGFYGIIRGATAVIEMAAASGLLRLRADERDPLRATTYGTGELILAALDDGCSELLLGVGGSATVDGGAGALQALGARLLDEHGRDLAPGGAALRDLHRIDLAGLDARLRSARVRVATDVRNPLLGPDGAAPMFGPQKGATPADVAVLEEGLRRLAEIALRDCGLDIASTAGGGAAGGLAAGLTLVGATIELGFDLVAGVCGLAGRIARADAVVTGEGRLDEQTPYGKTAWGVATTARLAGRPVGVIAGSVAESFTRADGFDAIEAACPAGMPVEEAMSRAAELVAAAAERIAPGLAEAVRPG